MFNKQFWAVGVNCSEMDMSDLGYYENTVTTKIDRLRLHSENCSKMVGCLNCFSASKQQIPKPSPWVYGRMMLHSMVGYLFKLWKHVLFSKLKCIMGARVVAQ